MILELVDESRLLIILSPEDMEDYQLTFDSLDWQNGHSGADQRYFPGGFAVSNT